MKLTFSTLFYFLLTVYAYGQTTMCGITVDAGQDISLCEPGGIVNLEGGITGNYVDFSWIGPVNDANSLSTTANVSNTTDFILEVLVKVDNLIINHDFEDGNTGFTSEYTYVAPTFNALYPEGVYTIHDNPSTVHNGFPACSDHTTGSGLYMQINGNANAGVEVWCQDVVVTPSSPYLFSAWTQSIITSSPAQLQFTINGNTLGQVYTLPGGACEWTEFNAVWDSGGNSAARICITNLNTATSGNDFGLDDIYFGGVCEVRDTITVEVRENVTNEIDTVICEGESIVIEGQTINAPGNYGPFTLPAANGCDSLLTINVSQIILDPVISEPHYLTCDSTLVTLSGNLSIHNVDPVSYIWDTNDGNIVSGQGTAYIKVDEPGTYFLKLIYDDGGIFCESEDVFIEVFEDIEEPEADIQVSQDDCNIEIWTLLAVTDIGNADFFWSTNDGTLIPPYTTQSIDAYQVGTYYLEVTNYFNGCSTMDTVTVDLNGVTFSILGEDTLTCSNDTILLYTSDPTLEYEWSTDTGTIIGNPMNDTIYVTSGGRYIVSGGIGDCAASDTIVIVNLIEIPTIDLGPGLTLDCNVDSLSIDATISAREDYEINWTTDGGSIIGDPSGTSIGLKTPGIYIAEIITIGGCVARDSVVVTEEGDKPTISITRTDTINCNNLTAFIDARNSDNGAGYSFTWTVISGGNIISDTDTLLIEVDSAGTYQLEILNTGNGCRSSIIVTIVEEYDRPEVDAGMDTTLLCGQTSLDLSGTITTPVSTDSIFWTSLGGTISQNSQTLTPTVTSVGLYILNVKNTETGCIGTDTMEVFRDNSAPDIVLIERDTLDCNNRSLTISASGSDQGPEFDPGWTTTGGNIISGADTYEITIDAPGTYTFTLTNTDNNCVSMRSVIVVPDFEDPDFSLDYDGIINCEREQDTISVNLDIDGSTIMWTASNGGNILSQLADGTLIVDAAGTYHIVVTHPRNGCTLERDVIIEERLNMPTVTVSDDSLSCDSDRLSISALINSLEGYTIRWTTTGGNILSGSTTASIEVDAAGIYTITVISDESKCVAVETVEIFDARDLPELTAGSDREITCDITTVRLNLLAWDSQESQNIWTDLGGTILDRNVDFIDVSTPGTYIIEATNPDNMCTSYDTIIVTENITLPVISINTAITQLSCEVKEIGLMADSDISNAVYVWTNSSRTSTVSSQSITVDSADTYQVVVTNPENGCSDSLTILISQVEKISFEVEVRDASCLSEEGTFTFANVTGGDGQYTYLINGREYQGLGPHFLPPGNYTLEIRDGSTCVTEVQETITDDEGLTIGYIPEYTINYGDSVILNWIDALDTALHNFSWNPSESLDCDSCGTPVARPEVTTTYTVTVTDDRGCMTSTRVQVIVKNEINYYVPSAFSPNIDGVNDIFRPYIGKGIKGIEEMRIYDRWGALLFHLSDIDPDSLTEGWDGMAKGQICDPGVYVYSIKLLTNKDNFIYVKGDVTLLR